MPTPTIPKGEEHFFPIIYEGNGGGQRVGKFVPFTDQATIANSVIFNSPDDPKLGKTFSGAGTEETWTFSCWIKLGIKTSNGRRMIFSAGSAGSNYGGAEIGSAGDDSIEFYNYVGGSYAWRLVTNRQLEDTSKWYHLLFVSDTTNSTEADRARIYIDGDRITSFSTASYPSLNYANNFWMGTTEHEIGTSIFTTQNFDGYMAEVNNIDNQALLPASFGITDTSTGRWIPKTVEPFPTTTTDIAVTVVSSGGNKFAVDGVTQGTVTLIEGATYKFDQSDSSNATHPLRFSTTSDGTHNSGTEYTTGVTTVGTPGSSGAYTQITVATGAPTLYYYCSSHSGMGGQANTQDQYGTNGFRLQFLDSTHAGIDTSGNSNTFTASNLIDFESQPIAMGGTAFDTGSAGAWDGSYPVANGFTESTSTQAIYNDGSTAVGGVIGWDFGSGRSANIQHIKINQLAVNNSITGFTFEYSDNGSDYTSVGTFSVTAATSTQTVSVLNTAGKHRYWRLKSTTNTTGGQSAYRWVVAFLGFFSEPVTTDSPTQNFATFSPSFSSSTMGLTEGNLTVTDNGGTAWETAFVGKPVQSGKWYFEATVDVAGTYDTFFGVNPLDTIATNKSHFSGYSDGSVGFQPYSSGDYVYHGNSGNNYYQPGESTSFANGDKIGIAYDADTGAFWAAKNNTWISSGNPSTGANPLFSGYTAGKLVYFGLSNTVNGTKHSVNFGQRSFAYTPPTGFSALQQDNMPETAKGVTGFSWVKNRDQSSNSHGLTDSSRGASKVLFSNTDDAQQTYDNGLTKFLKGGYACSEFQYINGSGDSLVSWNWVGNSGTTSSNTDGSISSTVQANTTAGFSIVQYTGTGSAGTVGHGLSSAPEWVMAKVLNVGSVSGFTVGCTADPSGFNNFLYLNETEVSRASSSTWNDTAPTSSVFSVGSSSTTNYSSQAMLAYCWHSVDGFSKFGSYEGNASADGTFVYTGFKPAFLMIKDIDNTRNWIMIDSTRDPFNPTDKGLAPSNSNAENTGNAIDFVSNGFKFRSSSTSFNTSSTYIYMAFAEHPFVGDGTNPVTAR